MINNNTRDQIRDAVDIVDVIGEFITLRKKGINYVGKCPFHVDKNPSFYVNPNKQKWRCFVEDIGGDVFDFLQRHENFTFQEALEWCARKANIEYQPKELTPEEEKRQKEKGALRVAITAAKEFYQEHLPDAAAYLQKRGFDLSDEVLQDFSVGYAPEGSVLKKELLKKGYKEEFLAKVDAIKKGNYGFYDSFSDRIMFPYFDLSGNVTGFSGRYIGTKEKISKYVNTGDTELFKKGNSVFGLYQAKKSISNLDSVYLVEGQIDVLSMHAVGVKNTVAAGGTALTPEQIKQILRFTKNITLVYDGDKAGQKAALNKCQTLLQSGASVRCVELQDGMDPDDLAKEQKEQTKIWLDNRTTDFVTYFEKQLNTTPDDPLCVEQAFKTLSSLVAEVREESLRNNYISILAQKFSGGDVSIPKRKVRDIVRKLPEEPVETMKPGIYGLDELPKLLTKNNPCPVTCNFDEYISDYGEQPIIYMHDIPSRKDIQELRGICTLLTTMSTYIEVAAGEESSYLSALAELYRNGITDITVVEQTSELSDDGELDRRTVENSYNFIFFYVKQYQEFFKRETPSDRSSYVERCADLISYASESVRIVNSSQLQGMLGLTQRQYNDILKPFLAKRKSRITINAQRTAEDYEYDPDRTPEYVAESEEYSLMHKDYGFYPRLNIQGEPVGYIFENKEGGKGHTYVADFYMTPLIHINDPDREKNKRIFKINRRHYPNSLYIEMPSKYLVRKSTIEEVLINLEAVNFSNGEEKHWTKIREFMSRKFCICSEINVYGNQQHEGFSKREDENFFAFSNGIVHFVEDVPQFTPVDELGVVSHAGKNYYLPAYSKIHTEMNRNDDRYEHVRTLFYQEIPAGKQCSFEHWASLMNKVYAINDNGKWAVLYAVMCAFRSNIHCIDRLFTALFFMGPMMSGKTQVAVSIRALFVSPKVPIFNLNIGTDAAMSTLMSSSRDVPVVLDEYNNKDISDTKFQALKGIVYDGDGKQKRKGTSGKEIENDKVYTPVIICGQETPQRDDNALMSRVIVCEVPKPLTERTAEQKAWFRELKEIEDPDQVGLSNVLFDILKLRPIIQDNFKITLRTVSEELTKALPSGGGDMVRIINTASLFLTMCKLLEEKTELKLPFTYKEFFEVAKSKVLMQVELISRTDKIATFFKAMEVMINTGTIKEGRDYDINTPGKLTIKLSGKDTKEYVLPGATRVLYLRISNIHTLYSKSSYNQEGTSQSTLEQNMRSNPAYIGVVNSRRFRWKEVKQVPKGDIRTNPNNPTETITDQTMIQVMESQEQMTSCVAINYDIFRTLYDVDFERTSIDDREEQPLSL